MSHPAPARRRAARHPWAAPSRRGAVLVVVLIVSALAALLLGGYLGLNLGTARLSQRAFDRNAAFHLAEAGLEEGLWTYNRLLAASPDAWTGWTKDTDSAWRALDDIPLSAAGSGRVKIYASPLAPAERDTPVLVALAEVGGQNSPHVRQMIEVKLRRRSFFAAGLVALDRLAFRGTQASFDSWDSDPDRDPATPRVPYSAAVASDTGSIGTAAPSADDLEMRHARVHGYFRGAGVLPQINSQGFIGSFAVQPGEIEPGRVGGDFYAAFPHVPSPGDGTYLAAIGDTLGVAGEKTSWRADSLHLSGKKTLTILGDVTLVLTATTTSLSVSGSSYIEIPPGSSLTLYVAGDARVSGQGVVNSPDHPAAFQIWSTLADPAERIQTLGLYGRGALSGVVYAPAAEVVVAGNGQVYGAIVARELTFTGNAAFHYDHSLGDLVRHAPYGPAGWRTVDDPARRAELLPLVDR